MGEVRKRKTDSKKGDKNEEPETSKEIKQVEKKSKSSWLWYLISPLFAILFTLKADQLLDDAISRTEARIKLHKEKIDEINRIWSPDIAKDYLDKFDGLKGTIEEMEGTIKHFGDEVFASYEDPFIIAEKVKKMLMEVKEMKATEDSYYRAIRANLKKNEDKKVPGFMELMEKHTKGLSSNLKIFQETQEEHEKALKDHDLTSIYVNLTEPIEQLKGEITTIVETCRDIGSNRFITEAYLGDLNARLRVILEKIDDGVLDGVDNWVDPQGAESLVQDVYGLDRELSQFSTFNQEVKDNYEQTLRNDKRARHLEITLDEKYRTPDEYKKMFKNLERWHTMPDMQALVGHTRKLARRANDLLQVECEDRQRDLIKIYYQEIAKQEVELDKMIKYLNETDLHGVFTEVVVNDIERKQVGLSRFINQMRYQIAMAEEKWATLYYEHLRSQKSELFENDDLGPGIEVIEEDQAVLDEIERADASPVPLD